MPDHIATCQCGQLKAICGGEPVRTLACYCAGCQSHPDASSYAAQARWDAGAVTLQGTTVAHEREDSHGKRVTSQACTECRAVVALTVDTLPGIIAIPLGAFSGAEMPLAALSTYQPGGQYWTRPPAKGAAGEPG